MSAIPEDEDDIQTVPIALDRESLRRLGQVGKVVGRRPLECAAALLRDLLMDEEFANIMALIPRRNLN